MINHIHIKELISVDFDGETTIEEKKLIRKHLNECSACMEYSRELNKLSATLEQWTNEDLSPDLEQKIQRGLKEANMRRDKTKLYQRSLFKVTVGGGGAIAAIVVLFLSMQTYTQRGVQGRLRSATDSIDTQFSHGNTNVGMRIVASGKSSDTFREGIRSSQLLSHERADELEMKPKIAEVNRELVSSPSATPSKFVTGSGGFQVSAYDSSAFLEEEWGGDLRTNIPIGGEAGNTEQYDRIYENEFKTARENPLATFSIDVDTASYSNVRRFLNGNQLPPADAVRIEELINYFSYDYPNPEGREPFSITTDAAVCPWNKEHYLVRIGLQGKTLAVDEIRPSNLVFLIDVSGSMDDLNKLPLLKTAFKMMVDQIGDKERVAIVVYAGAAGKVLDSTPGSNKLAIIQAIDNLNAGGSTAGGAGIKLAYQIAHQNFIKDGNNRVILATDGDFNVGASSNAEMVRLIEEQRQKGVFLTVLGFGTGNYKDSRMEQIADKGNGNYYYIDTLNEAKKVLVSELGSTLFTIAKDVKIQIEFNSAKIKAYRLIGYENRILAKEDFNDDTKDAGELGAGHTVTALYEIIPADSEESFGKVDPLVYQQTQVVNSPDLMTVKLRYKDPGADTSQLITQVITEKDVMAQPTGDFQFASAVAEFGLLLRNSQFKGTASYQSVLKQARAAKGEDAYGYRNEFIDLVEKAEAIDFRLSEKPGIIFKGQ
jgi:Ca-activated chloride channel family protein